MGEIDEVHEPEERDGQPAREHEQQHAIGNAIEQDGQHALKIGCAVRLLCRVLARPSLYV
jgi:hypothetical protein